MIAMDSTQAIALFEAGRYREVLDVVEALIDDAEEPGELYYVGGCASLALGDIEGAVDYFRLASSFQPQDARVWLGLGRATKASGAIQEAIGYFERAVALQPGAPNLAALALALLRGGDVTGAAEAGRRACELDPSCVEALHHRGLAERELGDIRAAKDCFERALAVRPDLIEVRSALAHALRDMGRSTEALAHYDAVLARDPDFIDASINRAHLLLMDERYGEGWDAYEARAAFPDVPKPPPGLPRWEGQPGLHVLVYGEQGIGDQVMFASCLPDVAARARALSMACHPKLVSLFARSFSGMSVRSRDKPEAWAPEGAQAAIALGSLPRIFRRTKGTFPAHCGYLAAAPADVGAWRDRFGKGGEGPRIGLSWRGGSLQTRGHLRSIDPALLGVLAGMGAARWFSLQYGDASEDCTVIRRAGLEIGRWPEIEADLDSCAAAIAALDIVITIDNTVAHLAGALGKPVWILLPPGPEWRYGFQRESLPWYPQARLLRRREGESWEPVLATTATSVAAWRAGAAAG